MPRKTVFKISTLCLKPACSITETTKKLEIPDIIALEVLNTHFMFLSKVSGTTAAIRFQDQVHFWLDNQIFF